MYRRNVPPAIIRDGNTVAWWDFSDPTTMILDGSNNCSVVFDKSVDSRFGSTLNSGNLVSGKAYKIISQSAPNYFATGKVVGDVFIASTTTALDANNTVQLVQGNPLLQATLANQPKYYATQTFGSALTTGSLVVGRTYQVLTTTANYFGSGVVVGNIFVASSTLALSGSNSVREEVSKGKELVFRSDLSSIHRMITKGLSVASSAMTIYISNLNKPISGTTFGNTLINFNDDRLAIAYNRENNGNLMYIYRSPTLATIPNTAKISKYLFSTFQFNGLSSYVIVNGVKSNLAQNLVNNSLVDLTFGGSNSLTNQYQIDYTGYVKEVIIRKIADSTGDVSYFNQYLKSKHQIIY